VTVAEGNSGTRTALFTVSLSAASSQTISVQLSTANGTAAVGSDYQAASGTLTFAPGETTKTIAIPINGDRVGEPNETFAVNLTAATNATIADGQGVGTILDDEPRISIGDVTKVEGKKGNTLFVLTVTLSVVYDKRVTMSFRTANGTATTGDDDYTAKLGTLTFKPGETAKTVTIEVKGDSRRESDEYFYLDLSGNSTNSLFAKHHGVGTILNDD
jgi:large repetitive protein